MTEEEIRIIKRRREVFWDTINYFRANPSRRAIDVLDVLGGCFYWSPKSPNRCAVGRLVPDEVAKQLQQRWEELKKERIETCGLADFLAKCDFKLPQEVLELGIPFLEKLQLWHDTCLGDSKLEGDYSGTIWQEYCRPDLLL